MAALFTPAANARLRAVAILACLGGAGAIAAPMLYIRTPYASGEDDAIAQPVEFDHRHHVRDAGIDCAYCHEGAETEASAGLPSTERCMGCHGQVWPESPELAPVRAAWRANQPLRWKRVNAVPAFVYFHHGVHATAGVGCVECHGRVEDMGRVSRAHDLSMDFCLDCHRRVQGSREITRLTTCSACHR